MKTTVIAALTVSLLLLYGCPGLFPSAPSNQTNKTNRNYTLPQEPPAQVPPPPFPVAINQTLVEPRNETPPIPLPIANLKSKAGYVNTSEIGGNSLVVVSAYDPGTPVNSKYMFNTTVSSNSSHLVFLKDKDNTLRAMKVSLPLDPAYLVFDARSTAKALLWAGGILSHLENERLLFSFEALNCWGDFYGYLKWQLPKQSLDSLGKTYNYKQFYPACIAEMQGKGLPAPIAPN